MPKPSLADQFDQAVQALLAPGAQVPGVDSSLAPLVSLARDLRDLPREEFKARLKGDLERRSMPSVTPYLVVEDAAAMIDFVKQVFGAEETLRTVMAIGSAGWIHAQVRIGDSMLMIGGGGPGASWGGQSGPTALHVYVKDVDAVHRRALEAGSVEIHPPADQDYGERGGGVKDPFGNNWYIATWKGETYIPEGLRTVNVYLHPLRAEPLIQFLKRAFGAEEMAKYASPDGVIHHAQVRIGDTVVEMGAAQGPYQPMPTTFYLNVPDGDATYRRALEAGATAIEEPKDQPYGAYSGAVKDAFGNRWHIATPGRS